jgi:hypothetical protein
MDSEPIPADAYDEAFILIDAAIYDAEFWDSDANTLSFSLGPQITRIAELDRDQIARILQATAVVAASAMGLAARRMDRTSAELSSLLKRTIVRKSFGSGDSG